METPPFKAVCAAMFLGCALMGCASMEAPDGQMAASRTAIEQARMAGAPEGVAAAEYASARAKHDRAEIAYRNRDYVLAGRLAREAEVDAQLAQARTSSSKSRLALAELEASTRALQEEIYRNTTLNPR